MICYMMRIKKKLYNKFTYKKLVNALVTIVKLIICFTQYFEFKSH